MRLCDRCKGPCPHPPAGYTTLYRREPDGFFRTAGRKDLCQKCTEAAQEWWNEGILERKNHG